MDRHYLYSCFKSSDISNKDTRHFISEIIELILKGLPQIILKLIEGTDADNPQEVRRTLVRIKTVADELFEIEYKSVVQPNKFTQARDYCPLCRQISKQKFLPEQSISGHLEGKNRMEKCEMIQLIDIHFKIAKQPIAET
jgi:hypothetical protein